MKGDEGRREGRREPLLSRQILKDYKLETLRSFLFYFIYKYNRIWIYDVHSMIIVFYYEVKTSIDSFLV